MKDTLAEKIESIIKASDSEKIEIPIKEVGDRMNKKITLFAKVNFYEINEDLNKADYEYSDGFIVTMDIQLDENLSVEEIAEKFGENAKEAFKRFSYGYDIEKKQLSRPFLDVFEGNIKK